jgi:hypothetical protein
MYGQSLIKLILLSELGLDRKIIQNVSSTHIPCSGECRVPIQNYNFFLPEMGSSDVVHVAKTDKSLDSRHFTDFVWMCFTLQVTVKAAGTYFDTPHRQLSGWSSENK